MLCLAAQRKPYGKLVVVSPEDGCEFDIGEDILNIHMIELGQFCRIDVENNVPVKFVREEKEIKGLKVEVKKDLALITGVTGKLTKGFALFYQTEHFGKVACRDEKPGEIGSVHQIIVSRLPEGERNGMYSKCVWGAKSEAGNALGVSKKTPDSLMEHIKEMKMQTASDLITSDTSEEDKDDSFQDSDTKTVESSSKRVTGFISGLNMSKSNAYVTCNLTFPGTDGIVHYRKNQPLKIGDFIEIRFSPEEFEKYFPPKPTDKTPKFFTKNFKKISTPSQYSIIVHRKLPQVTIKNVRTTTDHKEGDNIQDRFLGLVADAKNLLNKRDATFKIVVTRHRNFAAKDGKIASWCVKKADLMEERSEDSSDAESSSSKENKKTIVKKRNAKEENLKTQKIEKQEEETTNKPAPPPSLFPMPPRPTYPYPGMISPMNQPPGFYFPPMPRSPMMYNMNPRVYGETSNSRVPGEIRGAGFSEHAADNDMIHKRAVVTSVKPNRASKNGRGSIAYLWLLDDHKQSVFYISEHQNLRPGHFFDGLFARSGSKWECKKYVNSLGKLMDGFISNDSIELQLVVYEYFPVETGRLIAETYHKFLGKIADRYSKLPEDCSGGIKITVKLCKIEERNQYSWVVTRMYQSKHIQLLAEFYNAWQTPGIREMVRMKFSKDFKALKDVLDVQQKGRLKELTNDEAIKRNQASGTKTQALSEDEEETKHFGWVIVHDDNFVRMFVFPRKDGQEISELKKNVTDEKVYENVDEIVAHRLYRVKLDRDGRVVEMSDCPQYFSANEKGEIEFKFISTGDDFISFNVSMAEPVGMPKCFGKVLFQLSEQPISKKTTLWKGPFRFLTEKDALVNDEKVMENGVCFSSTGPFEKLSSRELSDIQRSNKASTNEESEDDDIDAFKAKLESTSKDTVYSLYKVVHRVLRNEDIVEELKRQGVYTESLQSFLTPN